MEANRSLLTIDNCFYENVNATLGYKILIKHADMTDDDTRTTFYVNRKTCQHKFCKIYR